MTADYDVWYEKASAVARDFPARGQALQIIAIRTDDFLAWLEEQGGTNDASNRLRYVKMRAAAAAQTVGELAQAVNTAVALIALRAGVIEDERRPLDMQN
ncbi:MAG TPA: hypothetical protein VGN82_03460 [Bosea sp. (in: a-proteobacteria)]|jgi:thymidine phosphorylase|uniref:hypothetical protein n=1 Tax=Bosea sp. (in: a-proteobacteria) TaxID=1871050 RepID=UPI002E15D8C7|nr:hypothetical protein [Bosea sp. (in: a-proteobacteria)]